MFRTRNEHGASAVEYGLLIAGVSALIVVVIFAVGPIIMGKSSNEEKLSPPQVVPTSHWLITACYSDKQRLGGANPNKLFKLADDAEVDLLTGADNNDLSGLKLGKVYALEINSRNGTILKLGFAPAGVMPSRC